MSSTSDQKKVTSREVPVFKADVIRAMSPAGRGIAEILRDAGWIKITDEVQAGVVTIVKGDSE